MNDFLSQIAPKTRAARAHRSTGADRKAARRLSAQGSNIARELPRSTGSNHHIGVVNQSTLAMDRRAYSGSDDQRPPTMSRNPDVTELPNVAIDRESPVPFYFQLAELLEEEITSGRWHPGARVASEHELGEGFALSRTTVRQALMRLEQRGLISRRKGRGTFVERSDRGLWMLQSSGGFFHDEVDRAGRVVKSQILRAERGPLPTWACEALQLPPGSHGATLERLRTLDGLVALRAINHLPERLADAALMIGNPNESLYRRLHQLAGVLPLGGRRTLEAVAAEPDLAAMLELEPGDPVAFIQSVVWDESRVPWDCNRVWLRTDRTRVDILVGSDAVASAPELTATRPVSSPERDGVESP